MPTINIIRDHLFEAVGQSYSDAAFDELCFEFGVEVDKIEEQEIEFTGDGSKQKLIVYAIDIPANRYDLLCIEGFARALRIFLKMQVSPIYTLSPLQVKHKMIVDTATTSLVRPYVVCAILRNFNFDAKIYKSFIDLQEKLHQNICRKRTLVAIGTHDLDTIQGPFRYIAKRPETISFIPLTETGSHERTFDAKSLLDFYREDSSVKHLKSYTDIIYDSDLYPVIYDSSENGGKVLSLPPIINGKHSRIQMHTKNIFIECTGTDLTKCNIVLDTMVTMFSQYCEENFVIEPVEIVYENNDTATATIENQMMNQMITPSLSYRNCEVPLTEINNIIGSIIEPTDVCNLCDRMQLGPCTYKEDCNHIEVTVPPTRSDILHAVDVIEDIAIAHGYNNILRKLPDTFLVGKALPINQFTDLLRAEISRAGYVEMLTHGLCSIAENYTYLRKPIGNAVTLSNPANVDYQVVRTSLLPGALKTLSFNKSISHKEGIRLFEISDVVHPINNEIKNNDGRTECKNERRLVALHASTTSCFEVVHGLLDKIMACVQIRPESTYASSSLTEEELNQSRRIGRNKMEYFVVKNDDPTFFQGMSANIVIRHYDNEFKDNNNMGRRDVVVGKMGVLHPEVLMHYEIAYPCTAVELTLEDLI